MDSTNQMKWNGDFQCPVMNCAKKATDPVGWLYIPTYNVFICDECWKKDQEEETYE